MMFFPFTTRQVLLGLAFTLYMALPKSVQAQPTGGPYGPIDQAYSLPQVATIYFVAPQGDAKARGESADKPTTLASAIARVVSGDAIVLRGGVYRTGNLVLNQGITLQAYADEKPILKGTKVASQWKKLEGDVWQTQWSTLFPSKPMYWWRRERHEAQTPLHRFNNDMVFIDGKFLQSAGSIDELSADTYFINYDNNTVHIGTNPEGRVVEITAHDQALLRTSKEVHGKTTDKMGPKIRGITFTQYAWTALAIEGKRHFTHLDEPVDEPVGVADPSTYGKEVVGTLLENVTISYCSRVAGYFRGDGLIIRNSLISDTSTEGIYIIGSSNVLLERNIVQRNDIERITGYFVSAVKIINQTHNVVVRDNLILDNPSSHGVWYDVGNRNGVFVNNYVENAQAGFFFEISRGVKVAGNVFVDNDKGSWILNSADAELYNNTYINSPAHFKRDLRSASGDHFAWHPATGPDVDERYGHVFANNLMVASKPNERPFVSVNQHSELCGKLKRGAIKAMDGNVYVQPHNDYGSSQVALLRWTTANGDDCSATFASLDDFKQQFSDYDSNGYSLVGNPRSVFLAPDLRRYQLIKALPFKSTVLMPESLRKSVGWKRNRVKKTLGAYPF